jgi:hypothetical protein
MAPAQVGRQRTDCLTLTVQPICYKLVKQLNRQNIPITFVPDLKNLAVILFALVYLTLAVGFNLNVHYCKGEVESVSILGVTDHDCCQKVTKTFCCLEKKTDDCCDDEVILVQLDDDERIVQSPPTLEVSRVVGEKTPSLATVRRPSRLQPPPQYTSLPPPLPEPRWLMNCSLTFYG